MGSGNVQVLARVVVLDPIVSAQIQTNPSVDRFWKQSMLGLLLVWVWYQDCPPLGFQGAFCGQVNGFCLLVSLATT